MLAQKILLRAADGSLSVGESNVRRMLNRGMATAAKADPAARGEELTMPLNDGYVAHLLPLTAGERRRAGVTYEAVAALFVHSAAPEISSASEIVARRHNLTPMELTVLRAVVDVGGVPEVAEALGIARSTVRSYLLSVFAKTGSHRQTDLVKLVAGLSNPLRG
jgi:DNA-binding CsgD family transcriptional regulator